MGNPHVLVVTFPAQGHDRNLQGKISEAMLRVVPSNVEKLIKNGSENDKITVKIDNNLREGNKPN
ncbi:hypothetical protein ACOSQ3_028619 [Xanthoceras sorbifolium]